jgi:hypothetical protein
MIVVAPLPKKPSSVTCVDNWLNHYNIKHNIDIQDVEDACLELQQILKSSSSNSNTNTTINYYITRTGNPLVQDSSFIPLHQAVSQLSISSNNQESRRPRSYSVGDHRNNNQYITQQPSCKPVY